jgi:RNA polymerase sigma-70 factor (ECF subfamily)
MMFRDTTFSDVTREDVLAVGLEFVGEFVMDEEAFRGFYERTSRSVWAYLTRITGDRQLADDLLQETYYRFLRASATYESETHRRNSLYKIATNLAHDARRRTRTTPVLGEEGDEVERARGGDGPFRTDQRADLDRAMSQLKPKERAMLWLAYAEGASHKEIAETLGLSPSSMKMILFRARRKLAGLLGGRSAAL